MSNNAPSTPSSPFPRSPPSPSAARMAAGRRIPSPINTRKDLTFEASKELGISLPAAAHSFRVTPPITPEKQRTTSGRTEVVNHMPGGVGTEVGREGEGESEMGGVGPADGSAASGSGASGWIGAGRERQSSVRGGAPPRQIQPPKDYSQFASSSSPTISAPAPNRSPALHQASLPYNVTPRRTTSAQHRQTASQSSGPQPSVPNTPSPFLLTVVPPMHLPHNPPHPRTSQMCSGYGPPDKFRRGTLVPLHPTLSSQLGAIAREYGLPSTGGLVVYLLSTSDPSSSSSAALPGAAGLSGEGGPRIGEEAWGMLWGRLFETEEEERAGDDESNSDEDDYPAPPVPPIPVSHRPNKSRMHNLSDNGVQSPDASMNSNGREDEADIEHKSFSSDADESLSSTMGPREQWSGSSTASRLPGNTFDIGRGPPPGLPSPVSRSNSHRRPSTTPASSSSHQRQASRQVSRQSILSHRSSRSRITSPSQPLVGAGFGHSLIVGKIEFDIDWRRGGRSRWYEGWVEGAEASGASESSGVAASPMASFTDSGPPTGQGSTFPPGTRTLAGDVDGTPRGTSFLRNGTQAPLPARQALFLPSLVGQRRGQEGSTPDLAVDPQPVPPPEMRIRTASGTSRNIFSGSSVYSHPTLDNRTSDSGTPRTRSTSSESSSIHSSTLEDHVVRRSLSIAHSTSEYAPLVDEEEPSEEEEEVQFDGKDPLEDVFPSDEATWKSIGLAAQSSDKTMRGQEEHEMVETTGLGIMGARVGDLVGTAPAGVVESKVEETRDQQGIAPVQDDVAEVMAMLRSGQSENKSDAVNLASPIHLDSSPSHPGEAFTSRIPQPVVAREQQVASYNHGSAQPTPTVLSPVVVPPTQNTSPESFGLMRSLDSQRASTIGLNHNLDELERALADLSPRAARVRTTSSTAAAAPRTIATILPPVVEDAALLGHSPPANSTPRSRSPSPLLASRPTFVYPVPRLSSERRDRPTIVSDVPGYSKDSIAERDAPISPPTNGYAPLPDIRSPGPLALSYSRAASLDQPSVSDAVDASSQSTLVKGVAQAFPVVPDVPALPVATAPVLDKKAAIEAQRIVRASPLKLEDQVRGAQEPPLVPTPSSSGPRSSGFLRKRSSPKLNDKSPKLDKKSPSMENLKSPKMERKSLSDQGDGKNSFFAKPTFKFNAFFKRGSDSASDPHVSPATSPKFATSPVLSIFKQSPREGESSPHDVPKTLAAPPPRIRRIPSTADISAPVISPDDIVSMQNPTPPSTTDATSNFNSAERSVDISSLVSELAPSRIRYNSSAPATPTSWSKPAPEFNLAASATSSPSHLARQGRPKVRLSADIDHLLRQMNEIDFGEEDSEDRTGSESSASVSTGQHRLVTGFAALSPVQEMERRGGKYQEGDTTSPASHGP